MGDVKVVCAYPHGPRVHTAFMHSLEGTVKYDRVVGSGYLQHDSWKIAAATTNITRGRNEIARMFLEHTDADWLWFIDTDQPHQPDLLERLVASADPVERPIVSALIAANRETGIGPACVIPTGDGRFALPTIIPKERWWACIPGTGCVLIHRRVLEAVGEGREDKYFRWFADPDFINPATDQPDTLGEDYYFMLRAIDRGFTPLIDTSIHVDHVKEVTLTPAMFGAALFEPRTYVVIPVKNNRQLTEDLLKQLSDQGGYDAIFVYDNGSNKSTRNWLSTQRYAEVFDAEGLGIHEMWNLGAKEALRRWPRVNVAFLNNDLDLGPDCLTQLAETLRSHPTITAVCPNYDGRELDAPEQVTDICANRYDGTGGFAGFCFMVKGEWLAHYEFPEFCKWWYGDNHFVISVTAMGGVLLIDNKATVVHVDGGGQSADWMNPDPELAKQLAQDRAAFEQWAKGLAA